MKSYVARIIFALLVLTRSSLAWPPIYGPEFTFTNGTLYAASIGNPRAIVTEANSAARDRMAEVMIELCARRGDCTVAATVDKYDVKTWKVSYPDGWWFQISIDPSVVEIQAKPVTLAEFTKYRDRIQNDIFEVAESIDLKPDKGSGGGHIHIGTQTAFENDPKLFRNFLVDYTNHPELAFGILEEDFKNALPFAKLSEDQRAAFAKLIQSFDQKPVSVESLARSIETKVYRDVRKYNAVNLRRTAKYGFARNKTVELRAIRTQLSADEYLLHLRLIEARLNYLKTLKDPVPFLNSPVPRLTGEKVNAFYRYVTESGLDWDEFKVLMPRTWQDIVPDPLIKIRPIEHPEPIDNAHGANAVNDGNRNANCLTRWLHRLLSRIP
ncbi:MAG: hypothetical protein A2428_15780 [Bdellovibrionales bacterium RIFOXYC1_FULL_54_43]|nr:MAG: hypothetical protein A2428_15780 [Bdellovibrionales bacterium RIFOXYC1_FULL_54_43]OFZ85381.1 MAG: hypothetical protein A2603_00700 [Bdellovibrionales bacterium RIFOXYD1_FULL_55_31]